MYVLPFGPRRALVEYTLFSPQPLPRAEYEAPILGYLNQTLGLATGQYRVVAEEGFFVVDQVELEQRGCRVDTDFYGGLLDQAKRTQLGHGIHDGKRVTAHDLGCALTEGRVVSSVFDGDR